MVTSGPIKASGWIYAVGSIKTFPIMFGPTANLDNSFSLVCYKYKNIPAKKSFGYPTSIQKLSNTILYNWPSFAISGKIYLSIEVGTGLTLSIIEVLNK